MMYLLAWVANGAVTHVHCSDRPIKRAALNIPEATVIAAQVDCQLMSAQDVLQALSWNGETLSGLEFTAQRVVQS